MFFSPEMPIAGQSLLRKRRDWLREINSWSQIRAQLIQHLYIAAVVGVAEVIEGLDSGDSNGVYTFDVQSGLRISGSIVAVVDFAGNF